MIDQCLYIIPHDFLCHYSPRYGCSLNLQSRSLFFAKRERKKQKEKRFFSRAICVGEKKLKLQDYFSVWHEKLIWFQSTFATNLYKLPAQAKLGATQAFIIGSSESTCNRAFNENPLNVCIIVAKYYWNSNTNKALPVPYKK